MSEISLSPEDYCMRLRKLIIVHFSVQYHPETLGGNKMFSQYLRQCPHVGSSSKSFPSDWLHRKLAFLTLCHSIIENYYGIEFYYNRSADMVYVCHPSSWVAEARESRV
jgi:hypothetical protein